MDATILERLFSRALKTCKFFPKISEILEPLENAEKKAAPTAAEEAWERVLEIRRVHWNPDLPYCLDRVLSRVSERIRMAARAAGVFRDFDSVEALHVWAKKRFVESFIGYSEREQEAFLLPAGEIKNLLAGVAETKILQAPVEDWSACRARGEEYRAQLAARGIPDLPAEERLRVADDLSAAARKVLETSDARQTHAITSSDEQFRAMRYQAEIIKRKYPAPEVTDPILKRYILEPIPAHSEAL